MGRRRQEKENIRKIQHSRGSYHISIPIEIIRDLKWQERQQVVVEKKGKTIIIRDWSK